jgi:nucleotide-binding universal stress UspA family protein
MPAAAFSRILVAPLERSWSERPVALAERTLEKARQRAATNGLTSVCAMQKGRTANEIRKVSEEHQYDVLVIGSRGPSGVKRVTMGETGQAVILKAPLPVIVVQ